jgi:hypothetical protein
MIYDAIFAISLINKIHWCHVGIRIHILLTLINDITMRFGAKFALEQWVGGRINHNYFAQVACWLALIRYISDY